MFYDFIWSDPDPKPDPDPDPKPDPDPDNFSGSGSDQKVRIRTDLDPPQHCYAESHFREYPLENRSFIKTILACLSGAQVS